MAGNREKTRQIMQMVSERLTIGDSLNFAASEAYKLLRTNITFALPDEKTCRVIGVTSSCSGEGKSTTALNLAYMLAKDSKQVLLVEADMRMPSIARRLNLHTSPGLSNILAGQKELNAVLQNTWLQDKLCFISSGEIPPNPSELLGSKSMRFLLDVVSGKFDYVILDLPPVTEVSDALVASKMTDGMIVVVRQNYASRRALADTMQQLKYAEAKILGFVMTCSDAQSKGKKYYKKGYGYANSYAAAK